MRVVALVGALVACVHAGLWALAQDTASAPNFTGQLASVSYTPFDGSADPRNNKLVTPAQVRADLKAIAPYTRMIRTYSATNGMEIVPAIAAEFGLRVSLGAWLDTDVKRNEREIEAVIKLARQHRNIDSIVVGNETIFRGEQLPLRNVGLTSKDGVITDEGRAWTADEARRIREARDAEEVRWVKDDINVRRLGRLIKRVKRETGLPVTTGEIHSVWRYHPSLASAVDFIGVHVLPYWEGFSEKSAVDQAMGAYDKLRRSFPGKRIVIAEFGWPSAGPNRRDANPGEIAQAEVLRDFVRRAEALSIDYNIIEAYDQPWKTMEGGVGPYWGLFDASRTAKFSWTGPITDPNHWKLAAIAVLIGVLLSLPILGLAGATLGQAALLAAAAHAVGAWFAIIFEFWYGHYFVLGSALAFAAGLLLLIPLIVIALSRIDEIAAVGFGRAPRRLVASPPLIPDLPALPKVSIHIPSYNEPPEMLRLTLDSVAALQYPNFECIVVINNTPDPALWRPVEEHCRTLGERFKFVREDNCKGFKAGALRLALTHTAPDAEIIGVLDADYVVQADWLKDLAPLFADPKVGLVQAPQDHRDGDRTVMHHVMNGESAGFFDIGMVQRNEANAIIVHGTMCLIRREALVAAGGWSSDTICEDTDLGLTILELGWLAHYTNRRYGHGLLPDTFLSYKRQRHRWAYGGFQILKKHWRRFLPGASALTSQQKREFMFGWLKWLGAESVGVLVALLNLIWVPIIVYAHYDNPDKAFSKIALSAHIAIPDVVLTIPILAAFVVTLAHFISLYRLRVRTSAGQMLGSALAAMSLQWTVARAVGFGLVKDRLPFVRTAKGGSARRGPDFPAFWEAVIGALLLISAVYVYAVNFQHEREITLLALVLAVQSLPFLATVALAVLEISRVNEFATWRSIEAKFGELFARRPALPETPAPAEKRVETAQ